MNKELNNETVEVYNSNHIGTDLYTAGSFSELYKYHGKTLESSQRERRESFLRELKEKRHKAADKNRQQFELFINENYDNKKQYEEMEVENIRKKSQAFKFTLMVSEWFTEIPDDLEENWLVKFAPEGFRVLLVARQKQTLCYNEKGRVILRIKSNFPGGGGGDLSLGTTILDCIYNSKTKTIFVLDCLCWNNLPMIDSDAKLRFYWLDSKYAEQPELAGCTNFRFTKLDAIPAKRPLIQDQMFSTFQVDDNKYYYDGIVFYHQESHYTFGATPLVGWLASYMLPEMLRIDVAPEHLVRKPENYQDIHNYLYNLKFKSKKRHRRSKKGKTDDKMDTSLNCS